LVTSGLALMHDRGYHAAGVTDIAADAGVAKGGFYSQFASKDDLGVAVVDKFADRMFAALHEHLDDPREPSPLRRLHRYFAARIAHHEAQGFVRGCLLGNFALELGDHSEPVRQRVEHYFEELARALAEPIRAAQAAGEVRDDRGALPLARFVVTAWEGALLAMRARKSAAPLREFVAMTLDDFLVGAARR
jgi:TetR/AcrR family transcriptional repressor of nem operon